MKSKVGILTLISKDNGGLYQYVLVLMTAFVNYSKKNDYVIIKKRKGGENMAVNEITYNDKKNDFLLKLRRFIFMVSGVRIGDIAYDFDNSFNPDLIICPSTTLAPSYIGKPYIVTIHDFQHKYYPGFFSFKERIFRDLVYKKAGQKAARIVCESNFVKKDIIKFLNIPEEKIAVLTSPPLYTDNDFAIENDEKLLAIQRKYSLPAHYLFYPAQFWFHKNHINLIRALGNIKFNRGIRIPLVLTGTKKNNFQITMEAVEKTRLFGQVKYLGYVPDEDMPYIYKLSRALVVPTLFESVSMPIWEAFSLGVPVICSNVCSLPEQVGDAGLIFDPNSVDDIADKIYNIWDSQQIREELVKKGYERIKHLSLENYAAKWEELINEIVKNQKNE